MRIIRWIIDQEPAVSAGVAAAVAVISAQAATDGWTWTMLWAALPLALSAGVRTAVWPRNSVAKIVQTERGRPT